jgi:putative zinc finger/helix-turn-helix YgiT family protein
MKCFICGEGTLRNQLTDVEGEVRKKRYTVQTPALVCDACGHVALEGRDTQEFMRRIADEYRSRHDLLTSAAIRKIRGKMSQSRFAKAVHLGVATIKRCELGLIQDKKSDQAIRAFAATSTPKWMYMYEYEQGRQQAAAYFGKGSPLVESAAHGPPYASGFTSFGSFLPALQS